MSAENYESLQDHEKRITELEQKIRNLQGQIDLMKFRAKHG